MTICIVNLAPDIYPDQIEVNHRERYTGMALARILKNLAQYHVQFISLSGTKTDAVITVHWGHERIWKEMSENPRASFDEDNMRSLEDPTEAVDDDQQKIKDGDGNFTEDPVSGMRTVDESTPMNSRDEEEHEGSAEGAGMKEE
ncbi:hypothetical protein I302_104238 [Kwoniella bestiolae CBS 10118]|uniref:Uncharacterized protein n=1 Tax=Kwoniella bestiolae CBS 10118 TaxID=1296100 RepID=A0A1B9GAQ7_9TREE|nr:hypothetical protein I302_02947 [Kwoniella bestiolae CBS 10118]OCF28096.1 hypothetical protein I302_02947 [Kwoniella bestiolae CBS 10118]